MRSNKLVVVRTFLTHSRDTELALEDLVRLARERQLIGMAYVAMYVGREYRVGAVGAARTSPTYTRGMVRALDEELGRLILPGR